MQPSKVFLKFCIFAIDRDRENKDKTEEYKQAHECFLKYFQNEAMPIETLRESQTLMNDIVCK